MKVLNIEEIKEIQLNILEEVASFCKMHNLRYTLAYGTLLGAVRHKGYIPWDDDIDIHMPRPDYEKFIKLYSNAHTSYKVITHEADKRYNMPFAKVHYPATIVRELHLKPGVFGVYIDIFPIDALVSPLQATICAQCKRFLFVKSRIFLKNMPLQEKARLALTKLLLLLVPERLLLWVVKKCMLHREYDSCELVCSLASRTAKKEVFPRSMFDNVTMLPFEGKEYCAVEDYHTYLSKQYGDYMQLPPEEKRASTHNAVASYK